MKIATKIAGFLMSCLTLCTALQPVAAIAENTEMARPRSTIDLSRKDRLTGTPGLADTPGCPSGQVLSGGACVLISNQAAGLPAWTSYFVGQKKCVDLGWQGYAWNGTSHEDGVVCATIQGDGTVTVMNLAGRQWYDNDSVAYYTKMGSWGVPAGNNPLQMKSLFVGDDDVSLKPILTNQDLYYGRKPSGWSFRIGPFENVDGGSRP